MSTMLRMNFGRFFFSRSINFGPLIVRVLVVIYSVEFGTLGFVEECRKTGLDWDERSVFLLLKNCLQIGV